MSNSPEVFKGGVELSVEAQKAAGERSAELAKDRSERGAEASPESQAEALEAARLEANKEALMSKERGGSEKKAGGEPTAGAVRKITKDQKNIEYAKTMREIQSHMSPSSRTFSKIIHNPIIEKTSGVVGSTVARPNAILFGSTSAFILVAIVYLVSKHYGYVLSGFESIGAFIVGWAIGMLFDYFRILLKGRSPS